MKNSDSQIKLVITDIDGVWTDGGMYYDETGNELKLFNTSDSAGVLFCNLNNIDIAIITGECTQIVANRARKLGVQNVFQGVSNKLAKAKELASTAGVSFSEIAYIGDDINDIPLLQTVGLSATVPSAPIYVKRHAMYITKVDGGKGAFRDFVEYILDRAGLMETTIERYLNSIDSNNTLMHENLGLVSFPNLQPRTPARSQIIR